MTSVDGYTAASYGEGFADVYDDWYADVSDVDATVERIVAIAGGGRVLELGIGSGRLALPLAAQGIDVWGIDASPAMVDRLRAKPGGGALPVAIGDMAALDLSALPGGGDVTFAVVLAAYNTFLNLLSAAAQLACLTRSAARLAPGGRVVIEAFVPDLEGATSAVEARSVELDRVVLTVSRRSPVDDTVDGQHIEISERGIRLRPWRIRCLVPEGLDALAGAAGLRLVERWSSWDTTPFQAGDPVHISVYTGR
jgi:SAM-dependent methyltransferase